MRFVPLEESVGKPDLKSGRQGSNRQQVCACQGQASPESLLALRGEFELTLHKRQGEAPALAYPRGETPTHWITMGMDPDLDQCLAIALRDMIALLGERGGLSREDAYKLCSLAVDFRVTQTVNTHRGVHAMLAKSLLV